MQLVFCLRMQQAFIKKFTVLRKVKDHPKLT